MSPKLAAIGVATLSGFIFKNLENDITAAVIKPKQQQQQKSELKKNFYFYFFFLKKLTLLF